MPRFPGPGVGVSQNRTVRRAIALLAAAGAVLALTAAAGLGGSTRAAAGTVTAASHAAVEIPAATAPATGMHVWRSIAKAFRAVNFSLRTPIALDAADVANDPACVGAGTCFQLVSDVTAGNPYYCLNANDSGGLYDGVPMQIWTCNLNSNDLWEVGKCLSNSEGILFCQLESVWNTKYCLNADDTDGLYNGSYLQLWTCNVASPYNDLWAVYSGNTYCFNYLTGCLGVADEGDVTNGPYIATVDEGDGTPGNGTTVWMWLSGDEKNAGGILWAPQVNGEPATGLPS